VSCTLSLKKGVRINGLTTQALLAIQVAHSVASSLEWEELVITSCSEGRHSRGSLHYVGNAFDLRRSPHSPPDVMEFYVRLKECLGKDYDVVLKVDHIHVEYQPKEAY
jgi:hypothetical protein